MEAEAVEKKLYNAASKGDATTLVHLLEDDPYLIHGVLFPRSRNILHVAAIHGQASIVEQVLSLDPQLARSSDSEKSSPLHIAAAGGHIEIASKLLSTAPEMCWRHDDQGMNPVHVAAMNGHVEILEHLLLESYLPAMERLHRGQTVLHLCVKHGQLRALKVLVEKLGDLVCTKDDDGDTLLHLAVRCNQLETVRYLVENKSMKHQTKNSMGKTALEILKESPPTSVNYLEMKRLLIDQSELSFMEVIPEMSNTIMVVVVLIATMAFQSAISPAGGVWAEDDDKSSHKAGKAVIASTHPKIYMHMIRANMTAFMCSVAAMYLFTIRIHLANYTYSLILVSMVAMGAALHAIMYTFLSSMDAITPDELLQSTGSNIVEVVMLMLSIFGPVPMCVVGVRHLYRLWLTKKIRQLDLAADAFPWRVFYWIFQQLETRGFLRAVR